MIEHRLKSGMTILLDDCDAWVLEQFSLCADRKGAVTYVRAQKKGTGAAKAKKEYLHRLIMGLPDLEVDHRDMNGLNNTRGNLRLSTKSQNNHNKNMQSRNTSGFKGVYWNKIRCRWFAKIKVMDKEYKRGYFHTAEEAASAYADLAKKHEPEFCRLDHGPLCLINHVDAGSTPLRPDCRKK